MAQLTFENTTLNTTSLILTPLASAHKSDLLNAAADGELWNLWFTNVPSENTIDSYLETAFEQKDAGTSLPFVVKHKATGQIIGATRFCNADLKNKRLEIGYTWYAKRFQRSSVNTECKLALLTYAFETLQVIAVEFRTHWHNQASRNAILRLGAKQDGVLRQHQRQADGSYRDTVVFSILNSEWPTVKKGLMHKLSCNPNNTE